MVLIYARSANKFYDIHLSSPLDDHTCRILLPKCANVQGIIN